MFVRPNRRFGVGQASIASEGNRGNGARGDRFASVTIVDTELTETRSRKPAPNPRV